MCFSSTSPWKRLPDHQYFIMRKYDMMFKTYEGITIKGTASAAGTTERAETTPIKKTFQGRKKRKRNSF